MYGKSQDGNTPVNVGGDVTSPGEEIKSAGEKLEDSSEITAQEVLALHREAKSLNIVL